MTRFSPVYQCSPFLANSFLCRQLRLTRLSHISYPFAAFGRSCWLNVTHGDGLRRPPRDESWLWYIGKVYRKSSRLRRRGCATRCEAARQVASRIARVD